MLIIQIILMLCLFVYHGECAHTCKRKPSEDDLVQMDTVHDYILETRLGITDGSPYVDVYLKTCSFKIRKGHPYICAYTCAHEANPDCFASRIRDTNYCEHCMRNADSRRRNSSEILDTADVKVRLDLLPTFIDGENSY